MHLIILVLLLTLVFILHLGTGGKTAILKELSLLKTQTVNMLNKILKVDTTKIVDFHIPEVHCDGLINRILSPDELFKLARENAALYAKLATCGYTRTVGLLHGFALWTEMSKTKDIKSFNYFVSCINHIEWKDPAVFSGFHSPNSKLSKCIV